MSTILAGDRGSSIEIGNGTRVVLHGVSPRTGEAGGRTHVLLCLEPRRLDHDLTGGELGQLLTEGVGVVDSNELLAPFAVASWARTGPFTAATDSLGMRHLYVRRGDGWAALSTSARALAAGHPSKLDPAAIAAQSLLGWQIGRRTVFDSVSKVAAGAGVALQAGVAVDLEGSSVPVPPDSTEGLGRREAVSLASNFLRSYMEAYLDEHSDAVLQLTGGQDSRVLLSAIPEARRRTVEAMTLRVDGSPDADMAAQLAARFGMVHRIVDFNGLEDVPPDRAHEMAVTAAAQLNSSADPLAWASISFAESKLDGGPRLSGLGGEVARGFYYLGPARTVPITRERVNRLAKWRMFTNEAVDPAALRSGFSTWARDTVLADLHRIFLSYETDWLRATDLFYLDQRMQRWAGVLASATSLDRPVINPMLDRRFLAIAARLSPRDKQSSRFLSGLSVELDPGLAEMPLDGRPSPAVYAKQGLTNYARLAALTGSKVTGKVRQRLRRERRAPAGGNLMAVKLTQFYRQNPEALRSVAALEIFGEDWLHRFVTGRTDTDAATIALLVNLEVATSGVRIV